MIAWARNKSLHTFTANVSTKETAKKQTQMIRNFLLFVHTRFKSMQKRTQENVRTTFQVFGILVWTAMCLGSKFTKRLQRSSNFPTPISTSDACFLREEYFRIAFFHTFSSRLFHPRINFRLFALLPRTWRRGGIWSTFYLRRTVRGVWGPLWTLRSFSWLGGFWSAYTVPLKRHVILLFLSTQRDFFDLCT